MLVVVKLHFLDQKCYYIMIPPSNRMASLNIPVKTCKSCGEVFVIGYHASVGIQFWLTALTFVGGIVYWAIRGRIERCPKCKGREYETVFKTLEI